MNNISKRNSEIYMRYLFRDKRWSKKCTFYLANISESAIMSNSEFDKTSPLDSYNMNRISLAFDASRSKICGLNDAEALVLPLLRIVRTTGRSENIRPFSSGCHSQTTSAIPALSVSRIYSAPLDTLPDGSSIFREPTFRHFGSALPNTHKYSHLPDVLREPFVWTITCIFNLWNV